MAIDPVVRAWMVLEAVEAQLAELRERADARDAQLIAGLEAHRDDLAVRLEQLQSRASTPGEPS